MAEPTPIRWWAPRGSTIGLFAVAIVAGILFASTAQIFRNVDESRPSDLAGLITEENERVDALAEEIAELRAEHAALLEAIAVDAVKPSPELLISGNGTALTGEGVKVQMWDAPNVLPEDSKFDVNDLVIHQQDLEGVINALWAGGADGISVQGQRLTTTSAVRCIGNVLLLHGRQYSPPYVIEAIGEPERLREALADSPAVQVYLQYVEQVGLGWQVTNVTEMELPAATDPSFVYAQEVT
ncbi:MAG TPA: DUF881 domain-containing protein [Actinomycetales bacterium]|nr:DUF881 domain-containing protein [Actinomycetales bacterium]